jgi:hypothetical protein
MMCICICLGNSLRIYLAQIDVISYDKRCAGCDSGRSWASFGVITALIYHVMGYGIDLTITLHWCHVIITAAKHQAFAMHYHDAVVLLPAGACQIIVCDAAFPVT